MDQRTPRLQDQRLLPPHNETVLPFRSICTHELLGMQLHRECQCSLLCCTPSLSHKAYSSTPCVAPRAESLLPSAERRCMHEPQLLQLPSTTAGCLLGHLQDRQQHLLLLFQVRRHTAVGLLVLLLPLNALSATPRLSNCSVPADGANSFDAAAFCRCVRDILLM